MSADVRRALVDTPIGLSREQLFAETGAPHEKNFGALLSQLKGCGKIKIGGTRQGDDYYVLADWPESALRENFDSHKPTQRSVTAREFADQGGDDVKPKKEHKPKPERAPKKKPRGEASPPEPAPRPEDGGAQFAIGETGELGIEKKETKLKLDAGEFARLRAFIEKTSEVWT